MLSRSTGIATAPTAEQEMSIMREEAREYCPACGTSGEIVHRILTDRLFGVPGKWKSRKCGNLLCGSLWLDPRPVKQDLHKAYSNYYTHAPETAAAPSGNRSSRRFIEAVEQLWLSLLGLRRARRSIEHMFLEKVSPGRALEVGCGDGSLLKRLHILGWEVEGQDVDPDAAARSSDNFTVHLGELGGLGLPENSYDAIVSNHVIEHADDPSEFLRDCHRLLKTGGVLIVTTPNPNSYGHKAFGADWRGLDAPRHLHLLSTNALAAMASAAGFSQTEVWTSAARAGGMLAGSRDIAKSGHHQMKGQTNLPHLLSAFWYQMTARIAHSLSRSSGEEAILRACK